MRRKVAPINKPIICVNRGHKFAARPFALLNRRRILGRAVVASRRLLSAPAVGGSLSSSSGFVALLGFVPSSGLVPSVGLVPVSLVASPPELGPSQRHVFWQYLQNKKARRAFSRSISHICACSLVNIGPPLQMWSFSCLQRSPSKSLHSVGALWQ